MDNTNPPQQITLNIIPFTPPITSGDFAFYLTKKEQHYCPIHKDDIKGMLDGVIAEEELEYGNWLYTDFKEPQEDAIILHIDLLEHPHFGSHYYRYLLAEYFTGKVAALRRNFAKELELWIHSQKESTSDYNIYYQFTLKVQYARVTSGPELVLSFDGTTKVLKKSVQEIGNIDTELYNWILYKGNLYKWKYYPVEYKNDLENAYPILSNKLKPHFDIAFESTIPRNRYNPHYTMLDLVYKKFLNTPAFKAVIPISEIGFLQAPADLVSRIEGSSNELLFGYKKVGTDMHKAFRAHGPYMPIPHPNVVFFFIYHTPDKYTAVNAIYEYFKNGFNGQWSFPSMDKYIRQPFDMKDASNSIAYDSIDTAVDTVKKRMRNFEKKDGVEYFAVYINPVPKNTADEEDDEIYYKIKEILLYEGISSQVIKSENIYKKEVLARLQQAAQKERGEAFKEKQFHLATFKDPNTRQQIYNQDFNTFLPHIEVAILAKLGGIPWRLNRPTTNELIVGVGAFYSATKKCRFVGSAFCFNNEGIFKGFDCFGSADTNSLAASIREAVGKFIVANHTASRLVIHFYKDIGKKELQPIVDTLHTLGLNIPVVIVSINKTASKELLGFDMAYKEKMPYSGTFVKVGMSEYLLFNNTRYDELSKPKQREFHFPIKLSISSTHPELVADMDSVKLLIDQVYQFSRMYWKSTSQQSLPVTIHYPSIVAEMFPHFTHNRLADYGRENLWFL
ncbi:MAG: hypothetical protein M9898_12305 [Chitinophagaceae bacterium]|nr:hypothetical protein [Chitinophagaceae bacterium]